jgi:hypothetical protein
MSEQNQDGQQSQADYAGYQDLNGLVGGYKASSQEAQRQKQRGDLLEQQLQQQLSAQNQRQDVPSRKRPEERLEEMGIPVDAIDEMVNDRLTKAFQPISQGFQARNQLLSSYGDDYAKFESQVSSYVAQDPVFNQTYQRMFNVDPAGAMELAYLKFGDTKRKEVLGSGNSGVNLDTQAQASIPGSRTGESRDPGVQDQATLERAREHFQKTGNPTPYAKARLRQIIPDEFLSR